MTRRRQRPIMVDTQTVFYSVVMQTMAGGRVVEVYSDRGLVIYTTDLYEDTEECLSDVLDWFAGRGVSHKSVKLEEMGGGDTAWTQEVGGGSYD